jgi:hypothetical protein
MGRRKDCTAESVGARIAFTRIARCHFAARTVGSRCVLPP